MKNIGLISNKQVGINMAANIVSYSANIIVSFILTPFLINTLGKETYSFFPIANTIVSYMSVLTNSMNSMAGRFVTVSLVRDETDNANKYFSSTLAANIILSAILLIPLTFIVVFLDKLMDVPINSEAAIKSLFALVFSSAIINISATVFGIATFAKNRIDLRSLRELVTAILKIALYFVLYRLFTPSIVYVGIVTLIIAVINILFQIVYTRILLPEIKLRKEHVSKSHTKELIGSSCWNAINTFGNIMLAGMSMVLANLYYGATASGSYAIVNTVPQFINGVIIMLVGVFYPVITHMYAKNDIDGVVTEIKNTQSIVGVLGCAVICVFSSLSSEFFGLWTPGEDPIYLERITFFTIMPHCFIACLWPLTNLNIVMNKVRIPALLTLLSGMLNIATSFVVYKLFNPGLISLPIISALFQIVWIGIFIPIYATYNLQINTFTFYPILIKTLLCTVVSYCMLREVKTFFVLNTWVKLLLFGVCVGSCVLIFFCAVIVGPQKISLFMKKALKRVR